MRLFVALDIDEAIRHKIARFVDGVREFAPDVRWVRPESLHVTLKFIGEKSPEETQQICQTLAKTDVPRLSIGFQGYGFFPTSRAARVFWIGIQSARELAPLAEQVDVALHSIGQPREEHPYSPHLTLARAGRGSGAPQQQKTDAPNLRFDRLQSRLAALTPLDFGTMAAREFFLYQSKLSPGGSEYTKLAAFPLKPAGN